jgi:hypothetical protein
MTVPNDQIGSSNDSKLLRSILKQLDRLMCLICKIVDALNNATDEKVKYDSGDPTAGYLSDKVVAGARITVNEGTGANENKVEISAYPITQDITSTNLNILVLANGLQEGTQYFDTDNNIRYLATSGNTYRAIWNADSPVSSSPFLPTEIPTSTFDDGKYNAWGITDTFPDGKFVIAYAKGAGHISTDHEIVIRISTDEGKNWGGEIIAVANNGVGKELGGGGVTPTGRIILSYWTVISTVSHLYYIYSDDEGYTWSDAVEISIAGVNVVAGFYGGVIKIANNEILMSYYAWDDDSPINYSVYIVKSTDNGTTWESSILVVSSDSIKHTEASFCYLGGSFILGIIRDNNQSQPTQVLSVDNGDTWSNIGVVNWGLGNSTGTMAWLSAYMGNNGKRVVECVFCHRDTNKVYVIYGYAYDLIVSGVSGWDNTSIVQIGTTALNGGGYPTVTHPNGNPMGYGWYYLDKVWTSPVFGETEMHFFVLPSNNNLPLVECCFGDAPSDGNLYARLNGTWVKIDVPIITTTTTTTVVSTTTTTTSTTSTPTTTTTTTLPEHYFIGATGLLAYMEFTDTPGLEVVGNTTGSLVPSATNETGVGGLDGGSIKCGDADSGVDFGINASVALEYTHAMTICFRAKIITGVGGDLISYMDKTGASRGWAVIYDHLANRLTFIQENTYSTNTCICLGNAPTLDSWHFYAITYDGTPNNATHYQWYKDGNAITTTMGTVNLSATIISSDATRSLRALASAYAGSGVNTEIAQISVWDYKMNATQISAVMNNENP